MTAIGKGDFVEALMTAGSAPWVITKGTVYRVCEVRIGETTFPCGVCGSERDGIELAEVPPHPDAMWCPCAFRPISGGQPGMFNELLKAPTDAPTKEPVAA